VQASTTRIPRILFADDAVAARVLMSALLRRMNLKVDVAENGEEVLALFSISRFDLVLLDIDMPVMDGIVTARRIREMPGDKAKTPIIAISSYLSQFAGRQGDFDATVPKPVSIGRLWSAIARVLPDGHVCADRSSVLKVGRTDLPLIDTAGRGSAADGQVLSPDAIAAALGELRAIAGNLERATADDPCRKTVRRLAIELDGLASRIAAPRLQRHAAVLAALVLQSGADELRVRTRDVVSCVLATLGEFKRYAALNS
jgi:CheY-like chemotaxis protein